MNNMNMNNLNNMNMNYMNNLNNMNNMNMNYLNNMNMNNMNMNNLNNMNMNYMNNSNNMNMNYMNNLNNMNNMNMNYMNNMNMNNMNMNNMNNINMNNMNNVDKNNYMNNNLNQMMMMDMINKMNDLNQQILNQAKYIKDIDNMENMNNMSNMSNNNIMYKKNEEIKKKLKGSLDSYLKSGCEEEKSKLNTDCKHSIIIVNYYNIEKRTVLIDKNKSLDTIQANLFGAFFDLIKTVKRNKKQETTKYIIENPTFEIPRKISDHFFLEYENKIFEKIKKGDEIGLKNNSEVLLKLQEKFYNSILNSINNNNNKIISLHIKRHDDELNDLISISCNINQFVYEIIDKYRTESGDNGQSLEFAYNAKILDPDLTLSDQGIIYPSIIHAINPQKIEGGGRMIIEFLPAIDFADVPKNKVKYLKFSDNAPKWRKVCAGLNIFGICKNEKCEAFKKEVIYKTNTNTDNSYVHENGIIFNLNKELKKIRCPMCDKLVKPKTCGFWKCEYQFSGVKEENGEEKKYKSEPKETNEDNFEYFDAFKNGEATWFELIIYVLPKQKIKYSKN